MADTKKTTKRPHVIGGDNCFGDADFLAIGGRLTENVDESWWTDKGLVVNLAEIYPHWMVTCDDKATVELKLKDLILIAAELK